MDTNDKDDFMNWMKTGTLPSGAQFDGQGEHLVPDQAFELRKGFMGWFYRLIKSQKAFINHKLVEGLTEKK